MSQLYEDTRNRLLNVSKNGERYQDISKGRNRYMKRTKSHVTSTSRELNALNMDQLFKQDLLETTVRVRGETSEYMVKISFSGLLDNIKRDMQRYDPPRRIELRDISKGLQDCYNRNDIGIHCTCPDYKYRFDYWAHQHGISSEKNPDDP